jgi:putative DNA primase/helicase
MLTVPPALAEYKQWVLWKSVDVNGRSAKLPISAWSGKAAACNKPETWTSFRHVCYALRKYKAEGIGFVFTEQDPFCGVDLDNCRNEDGSFHVGAMNVVSKLNSYTEVSPSRAGLHVLVRATISGAGRRTNDLEVYRTGRYFTITGKHLSSSPKRIERRQAELDLLIRERFTDAATQWKPQPTRLQIGSQSDQELIQRAVRARSGGRFEKLWAGDTSDYEGDHSRADAALCRMLSYWTSGNLAQVDRLFRMSGLMRDKWNRKTGDETYGARTIRLSSRH